MEIVSHDFEDRMAVVEVGGEDSTGQGVEEVVPYRELWWIVSLPPTPGWCYDIGELHCGLRFVMKVMLVWSVVK